MQSGHRSQFMHPITHVNTGVGPEFLGRVRLGSSIASLVGVWIFQTFLKETKISSVLLWTALASVPLGFTQVIDTTKHLYSLMKAPYRR